MLDLECAVDDLVAEDLRFVWRRGIELMAFPLLGLARGLPHGNYVGKGNKLEERKRSATEAVHA
jgi:hypothetical protein